MTDAQQVAPMLIQYREIRAPHLRGSLAVECQGGGVRKAVPSSTATLIQTAELNASKRNSGR
jgi:hypothetical protein